MLDRLTEPRIKHHRCGRPDQQCPWHRSRACPERNPHGMQPPSRASAGRSRAFEMGLLGRFRCKRNQSRKPPPIEVTEILNETASAPASQTIGLKRPFDLFRLHPIPITEVYLAVDTAFPFDLLLYYQPLPTVYIDHLGLPECLGGVPHEPSLSSDHGRMKPIPSSRAPIIAPNRTGTNSFRMSFAPSFATNRSDSPGAPPLFRCLRSEAKNSSANITIGTTTQAAVTVMALEIMATRLTRRWTEAAAKNKAAPSPHNARHPLSPRPFWDPRLSKRAITQ